MGFGAKELGGTVRCNGAPLPILRGWRQSRQDWVPGLSPGTRNVGCVSPAPTKSTDCRCLSGLTGSHHLRRSRRGVTHLRTGLNRRGMVRYGAPDLRRHIQTLSNAHLTHLTHPTHCLVPRLSLGTTSWRLCRLLLCVDSYWRQSRQDLGAGAEPRHQESKPKEVQRRVR